MPISEPEDPTLAPTRARFVVAAWLCGLSSILYLDRICMAQAITPIREELGLTKSEMGYVMMAFILSYGVFAMPVGRWGDRAGPRSVLALIVLAWSAFTALTAVATGLLSLLLVRFLFGAAEAGAFPNAAKVVARWYPLAERGRVQGVMLAFAQLGAIVAPAATAYLIDASGWRSVFLVYAALGCVWAVGFWFWFRDDPTDHPGVNEAERDAILSTAPPPPTDPGPVPWRAVLTNRGIVVLCVVMILGAFYTYFFYGWLPTYLREGRGVSNVMAGWLSSLVIGGSGVGMLIGGWLADRISRVSPDLVDQVRSRRYLAVFCYIIAAACLFVGTRCDDPLALALLWSASAGAMHVTLPNWWSVIIPQAGRHTATLFGLVNGMGCVGALLSLGLVPEYADWRERSGLSGREAWDPIFDLYVAVLLANAVAWWLYRFRQRPEPTAPQEEGEGW
jgi:sugar phosphate permease